MEHIIEEILTLVEISLEDSPERFTSQARVVIEARDYNYRAMVTYPTDRNGTEWSIHAVAHRERVEDALEALAEKCGEKAAAAGVNL